MEKSYNRKGNLRFKSSNEAEKLVMEGRKAAGKLRKKLETVNALRKLRKNKNHIFLLHVTTQGSKLHNLDPCRVVHTDIMIVPKRAFYLYMSN